jgi:O-antigen/teichoic acid export membrane protein
MSEQPPEPVAPPARRHLGIGASASLIAQVGPILSVTVLSVVVARHLGPGATGTIALLTAVLEVLLAVFGFGLSTGITYLVGSRSWAVSDAFRETQRAALVIGFLGVAAGMVFWLLTRNDILAGISFTTALLGIGHLPFALSRAYVSAIAMARERYEAFASFEMVHSAVILVAGVGLSLPFGVNGALAGIALSNVAAAVAAYFWVVRYARVLGAEPREQGGGSHLRQSLSFGLKAWGANLLQLINYRLDLFLLGAFVARADVGRYSVALSVTALAWVLPSALETALFPRTADLDAATTRGTIDAAENDSSTARSVRHGMLLLVPTTLVVLFLVLVAVPVLYGSAFHKTTQLALILIPGVLALSVGKVVSAVTTGRGRPDYALKTVAMTVPVTVVLYVVLIPLIGVWGAAVASTCSYLMSAGLGLLWFKRTTRIPFRQALVPGTRDLRDYAEALASLRTWLRPASEAP